MRLYDNNERGAGMVEFALALPFALALILGVIDLAKLGTAYSTVRSSAQLAVRKAAARNVQEWNTLQSTFNWGHVSNSVDYLDFIAGVTGDDENGIPLYRSDASHGSWYACMVTGGSASSEQCNQGVQDLILKEVYRLELRAIAFANTLMSRNLGSSLYPCDANIVGGGEPGCFRCFTDRGDPGFRQTYLKAPSMQTWSTKVLALRCEYDVPIATTTFFMGWLPQHVTVKSVAEVVVNEYNDRIYRPIVGR